MSVWHMKPVQIYKIGKKVLIRRSIFEAYMRDAEKDLMEEKDMSDQKKILHDDSNGLDYVLVEDYYHADDRFAKGNQTDWLLGNASERISEKL